MKENNIKDVGVLTWHYYSNVGSALQAYALYTYIKKMGYSCEFINYRKFADKGIVYKLIRSICAKITDIFPELLPEAYRFGIYRFRKKYFKESKLIKTKHDLEVLNDEYKCFVCGSDQIWAPNVLDEEYLLPFVRADKYKFSYAASIGLNSIPEQLKMVYKQNLECFDAISVREKQGELLLKEFIDKKVVTVLDPTFLLEKSEWESLITKTMNEKFVFCYFLGKSESYMDEIERFALKNDLRVVRYEPNEIKRKGIKKYMGPEEFLAYIKDSKMVITDSFHGVALSINLKKDFFAVKRFSDSDEICQNSRVTNILNICNLNERLLENFSLNKPISSINYEMVDEKLQIERANSREFIAKCMEEGVKE